MRWPRCALCGCTALKSAHLTSPQTVSETVQNNKPKSELFLFFSTADAVDGGQDRARLVGIEPGRDIRQVVALAEQNAIDFVPAPCLAAHLCKQTIRGIAAEGQTEALGVSMSELSDWRVGSGRVLGGAMALVLVQSRERLG